MPATATVEGIKPPIQEQIAEFQRKIQLLEGDRKAYYESSQWTMKKNKETIQWLRQENKKLRKKLSDSMAGDEKVINDAFQNHSVEKAAMRAKSGQAAVQIVDQKVCDRIKRLNALKHETEVRKRRLEELQLKYDQNAKEAHDLQAANDSDSEDARSEGAVKEDSPQQTLRILENRLEKAQLKAEEAEYITKVYQKLRVHLQDESLTFQSRLDALEAEILRQRQELKELEMMNNDAQLSRDAAKAELQRQEEIMYRERKEREQILTEYKKQAEERKAHTERLERRTQRGSIKPDDLSTDMQRSSIAVEEEEKAISSFEEAFEMIKEATGVTDIQEIVERFTAQGETQKQLEDLKLENEKTLVRLKEEKERLEAEFQEMKYSGESKLSSGQQMLEELQSHLKQEEARRDKAKDNLDTTSKVLMSVKAGVEHLADKLQHVKLPKSHVPKAQLVPSSDEYVLDLLSSVETKLLKLLDELEGRDMNEILKEMEEDEFLSSIDGKLPSYNVRIQLPVAQKADIFEEDEDSDDDEGGIVTRVDLKRQSQQIIDSKTKKKTRGRKKKGKQ
ncbi:outer dynein arm-docking complex subunit 3 [Protopterus annectens]|uniref:outer dynein arm-docking complex subunit 3 n=1 Tax=Protopterus annectens TaxID=7888 RepID=UPI001CFA78FA|nr:outer dynein arm-docking complex subunit 3 [Protopterus annectens]